MSTSVYDRTPRISEIKHLGTIANQRAYRVTVIYGDVPIEVYFMGTPYGPYGVHVQVEGLPQAHRVSDPAQYGDTFDESWIERFYAR